MRKNKLLKIYHKLLRHFGPQHWWPGDTPFEVMVGAILTQNTNWSNVEKAIDNLRKSKLQNPKQILTAKTSKLQTLIKPSGYFRQKAKKLKAFCKWLPPKKDWNKIKREDLLGVWGIGPETADSILCYALGKKSFVIDAYTVRIFNRLGRIKSKDYHEVKDFFEKNLPKKLKLYQEFHALIVALGKNYCRPKPQCVKCPLKSKSYCCAFFA
ncbi:MAG: endonuclease III domain-containing protein [bacterium]